MRGTSSPRIGDSLWERLSIRRRLPSLRQLKDRLQAGPGTRILDVGGGSGGTAEVYAQTASEVTILEPDRRKLSRGETVRPRFKFVEGVAEKLPFEDGRFDRVVALRSLHHFEDLDRALPEIRRVLAPGGSLWVAEIRPNSIHAAVFRALHQLTAHGRLNFLSAQQLANRLRAAGFSDPVVEARDSEYLVHASR